jgi:hypothetical protein
MTGSQCELWHVSELVDLLSLISSKMYDLLNLESTKTMKLLTVNKGRTVKMMHKYLEAELELRQEQHPPISLCTSVNITTL